jgi:hypothetical protein
VSNIIDSKQPRPVKRKEECGCFCYFIYMQATAIHCPSINRLTRVGNQVVNRSNNNGAPKQIVQRNRIIISIENIFASIMKDHGMSNQSITMVDLYVQACSRPVAVRVRLRIIFNSPDVEKQQKLFYLSIGGRLLR